MKVFLTGKRSTADAMRMSRRGFTLIELLVVMAIISLLVSILTPSLARARQQAKATVCLTRLREFMLAATAYSNEYDFELPPIRYEVREKGEVYHGWAEALYQTLYSDDDYDEYQNYPVQRNLGGKYELWECKEGQPRAGSTGHYRVYEISWAKGSLDSIKPKLPLIMDANPEVTEPQDLLRSDIPKEHIAGLEGEAYIHERHYGGANFAYNDGHAARSTSLKEKLALDWDLDPRTPNR